MSGERTNDQPTQIVILGGSGDLSKRKLLPALFDLFHKKLLPKHFTIVGLARSPRTDEDYRAFVTEAITAAASTAPPPAIDQFCSHVHYLAGSFDDVTSYQSLARHLDQQDQQWGSKSNCLFYLAVPPQYYETIFVNLHQIIEPDKDRGRWSRLLVEKPFGKNLETAQILDQKLGQLFAEEQIYRIDHYLAKEAVQNILAFRFSNTLFTAPWNKDSVKSVHITLSETTDIANRGEFYDGLGALRDVGQNHLLQLLALTAMRCPESLAASDIQSRRVEVLQHLQPIEVDQLSTEVVRGQYEGYQKVPGVQPNSTTETYFKLRAHLKLPEWEGVPFYLSAGKALSENQVAVRVRFKDADHGPYQDDSCHSIGNEVLLTISPEQRMAVTLNAKEPGLALQLEQRTLTFTCHAPDTEITNSYEKVLVDCLSGDKTLFTTTDEVLAAWAFISPILQHWDQVPLQSYTPGSQGPTDTL